MDHPKENVPLPPGGFFTFTDVFSTSSRATYGCTLIFFSDWPFPWVKLVSFLYEDTVTNSCSFHPLWWGFNAEENPSLCMPYYCLVVIEVQKEVFDLFVFFVHKRQYQAVRVFGHNYSLKLIFHIQLAFCTRLIFFLDSHTPLRLVLNFLGW